MRLSGQFQFFFKKHKTNDFHPLRSFSAQKIVAFVVFVCLLLFCWLVLACECFFYVQDFVVVCVCAMG